MAYPPAGKRYYVHDDCRNCEHPRDMHTASGKNCEHESCECPGYLGDTHRLAIGRGGQRDGAGFSRTTVELSRNGCRILCDGIRLGKSSLFITRSWTNPGPRGTLRMIINTDTGECLIDGLDYHSALTEAKRLAK